ncbi:hypothetical protein AVEN_29331-1 [Araneus ventricosus]|uniref:Integrase catalytic domain-containing protein n=1 Tax=Araneus ventricosus TaxID=182803 RepID=A0A4Y2IXH6_ARAVE|nr:hypothetical protein AVEN_29331-1 [Araneus ventricosus]
MTESFRRNLVILSDGRYEVSLPFKLEAQLTDNKGLALKRHRRMCKSIGFEESGGLVTAGESSKSSDMLYSKASSADTKEELISASASDSRDCKSIFSNGGRTAIGRSSVSTEAEQFRENEVCSPLQLTHFSVRVQSVLSCPTSPQRAQRGILRGGRTVRNVIGNCVRCKRYNAKSVNSESVPLPVDRIRDTNMFEVTGIDLAGPVFLKKGEKVWIVLFTCAVYSAVYFELATSLSTNNFLLCFHRFIARRSRPSLVYTDNGSNFKGRILELIPGRDGKVRTLKLKCCNYVIIRPIQRIFPLEIQSTEVDLTNDVLLEAESPAEIPNDPPSTDADVSGSATRPTDTPVTDMVKVSKYGRTLQKPKRLYLLKLSTVFESE